MNRTASLRRLNRAGWVLACLWFLVALMPLRAWATAEAMVTMAAASEVGSNEAPSLELPPCHSPADHGSDDSDVLGSHASCAACTFCAPLIAPGLFDGTVSRLANATPVATAPGRMPEGPPEALFRPPRG